MKSLIFMLGAVFCATAISATPLLGAKECTWGPSYWCTNITSAARCGATKHCIQTVWEHMTLPEDKNEVCQKCIEMVGEARAQLESNETMEELKEVFEGSCKLIPVKIVAKECCKIADDFVPELVETLASEMNPQVVCHTAGLCNNARLNKLIDEQKNIEVTTKRFVQPRSKNSIECQGCRTVMTKLRSNFELAPRSNILELFFSFCRRMSSFSDGCMSLVLSNFNEIYTHLEKDMTADAVCHVAGVCSAQFHPEHLPAKPSTPVDTVVEIIPNGGVGVVPIPPKDDDLPCDLCEQLVGHLRDLLIANTTEKEFQRVLQGICTQTLSFKDECLNIVNEYYPEIYKFLIEELNSKEICIMAGLCPAPQHRPTVPMQPLLPVNVADKALKLIGTDEAESYKISTQKPPLTFGDVLVRPEHAQLPIDRVMPHSMLGAQNSEACTFCEYLLHYVQVEISTPKNEAEIKHIIEEVCDKLPSTIKSECRGFVETYGDAFVAILAQEIDPSQVCPLLSLCPKKDVKDVEVLIHESYADKPNCPLCLFAVEQLENEIKNDKTEETIRNALDHLCTHLPKNLKAECDDFVETYSKELIEMLVADLTPQEVCVYLRLCQPKRDSVSILAEIEGAQNGEILTNEIPDDTIDGESVLTHHEESAPTCWVCEYIMKLLVNDLKKNSTDEEIKHAVLNVCKLMPSELSKECKNIVDEYADTIIRFIINAGNPREFCLMIPVGCKHIANDLKSQVLDCAICEGTVDALDKLLRNPNVDRNIDHLLKKACSALPKEYLYKCKQLIDSYGVSIMNYLSHLADSRAVCTKIGVCGSGYVSAGVDFQKIRKPTVAKDRLVGDNPCTYGPGFWCVSMKNALQCNAVEHCQEKVWKGNTPSS